MGPADLVLWLARVCEVSCALRTCEYWLRHDWSSGNALLSIAAVEAEVGERLRLLEYAERFQDDARADALSVELAEGQPPVRIAPLLLRQWYVKYHPGAGPEVYTGVGSEHALERERGEVHAVSQA